MPLTLDLPQPLNEELTLEATREGLAPTEHATLLLYLATALLREDDLTPFQEAVRIFLSSRSLDADRLASALEELVRLCVAEAHDEVKTSSPLQNARSGSVAAQQGLHADSEAAFLSRLRAWRDVVVHVAGPVKNQRFDESFDAVKSNRRPLNSPVQRSGRVGRKRTSAFGKYAGIVPSSEEFMREKQREIAREDGRAE
jgi:hypothetical protein